MFDREACLKSCDRAERGLLRDRKAFYKALRRCWEPTARIKCDAGLRYVRHALREVRQIRADALNR